MEASDGLFSTTTNVRVTVLDVNDNNPVFNPFTYIVSNITENDNNVPKLILSVGINLQLNFFFFAFAFAVAVGLLWKSVRVLHGIKISSFFL